MNETVVDSFLVQSWPVHYRHTAIDHYYNRTAHATGGHFEHTASTQSPYDLLKYCVLWCIEMRKNVDIQCTVICRNGAAQLRRGGTRRGERCSLPPRSLCVSAARLQCRLDAVWDHTTKREMSLPPLPCGEGCETVHWQSKTFAFRFAWPILIICADHFWPKCWEKKL